MHMRIRTLSRLAFVIAAVIVSSCSAGQAPVQSAAPGSPVLGPGLNLVQPFSAQRTSGANFTQPALIATDGDTGTLEAWPLHIGGSDSPQAISPNLGIAFDDLAANGNVVAIAASNQGVILYNVATGAKTTLPDPFGSADGITIDKNQNIYIGNSVQPTNSIVMYPAHDRQHPRDLTGCGFINLVGDVAADNEGDVFAAVFTQKFAARVIELPNGPNGPDPKQCVPVDIKPSQAYAGIVIDPKTDDLLTLDNPDECAGGLEGRMVIYPKPYSKSTGIVRDLAANCSGGIKLSADSSKVFIGDEDVSGSFSYVDQRSFPGGHIEGSYMNGQAGGFTTIPNTLPN